MTQLRCQRARARDTALALSLRLRWNAVQAWSWAASFSCEVIVPQPLAPLDSEKWGDGAGLPTLGSA